MKTHTLTPSRWIQRIILLLCLGVATAALAQPATAPAQKPLLSVITGASPNVMFNFDNSGSMLEPFLDSYPFDGSQTRTITGATEYYNWTCNGSGYTGPFKDEQGNYYCRSSVTTNACPYGFTGPNTRADGSQYCTRQDPVYSCPVGYTGPTYDSINSRYVCSQPRIQYTCSDASYTVTGVGPASTCSKTYNVYSCPAGYTGPSNSGGSQICTSSTPTYSCSWSAQLQADNKCHAYSCPSGWTLHQTSGGSATCRKGSRWSGYTYDPSKLVASPSGTAATTTYGTVLATVTPTTVTNPSLLVATPYTYTQTATQGTVTNQYDNVQSSTKNTRFYGTSPYTSGVVRAQSRTTYGGVKITAGSYYAMRSGQVNPLYYDPNKTYAPRINYTGSGNYGPLPTGFVRDNGDESDMVVYNNPLNYSFDTNSYYPNLSVVASPKATDNFVYVVCSTYTLSTCTIHDTSSQVVTVTPSTTSVNLPAGNARTDCGTAPATTCSGAAERQNILNWYTYYRTRTDILATSAGLALANPAYSGKMRVGFFNIDNWPSNWNGGPYWSTPSAWDGSYGTTVNGTKYPLAKGVRPFVLGASAANTANTKPIFDWLYNQIAVTAGGTPLHNAIVQVGKYYQTNEPWYGNPTDTTSGQLGCRRAYNIMFSDGGWSSGTDVTTSPIPYNANSLAVTTPSGGAVTLSPPFAYSQHGDSNNPGSYIAYPDVSPSGAPTNTLAALASQYFWGWDLMPSLPNQVITRQGAPASWQNMQTTTIGYGIAPSGFTFDDVRDWQKTFVKLGYQSNMIPNWPTSMSSDASHVDDFVHAGYTGGGSAYAVRTSDDIRRTFDAVLADVVSASGNDAGVAVSGASSTVSTILGSLKYTVNYRTLDNSGDVQAWLLDANGSNASVNALWSAAAKMPLPKYRNLSTLSSTGPVVLTDTTTLSSLPADLQTLLNGNGALATDASFIRYLRGDDSVSDSSGNLYRRRSSLIAADVNAPPVYIGGRLNMGYDRPLSAVTGSAAYTGYVSDKGATPGTLYAPTNDGQVHVINAANDQATPPQQIKNAAGGVIQPGVELWSYLIKSSLPLMQNFANPAYNFQYVLDGPVSEQDIYNPSTTSWKQMVYGSLGRAGKGGVYALNAPINKTDPTNLNRIPNQTGYQWETTQPDMGYITNQSMAGQTKSGNWVVLANSGHYAGTGKAGLYVLDANTGALVQFVQLPAGYPYGRGLGGVTVIRDADRRIVGAYAGDDGGNLWRFDLSDPNPANWAVLYGKPLFTTPNNQPIYAAPAWSVHPGDGQALPGGCVAGRLAPTGKNDASGNPISLPQQCGAIVVFGTGALLDDSDMTNVAQQTIYGIWDYSPIGQPARPYRAIAMSNLVQQTISATGTAGTGINVNNTYYQSSNNTINWATQYGWYMNMNQLPNTTGERVIGDPFNLGSSVFVTSVVANNTGVPQNETCAAKSSAPNVQYGLDALTGVMKRSFDQNGDGKADLFAIAYLPNGGFTRGSVITQTSGTGSSTAGIGEPNEGNPDLAVQNKCTGQQGYDTGIGGSNQIFDGCPAGWNRAWRQILNPPSF